MKRRVFFLIGFMVILSHIYAQQVSNAEFKAYKDSVSTVIKDLRKQINEGDDALKKAESLYEKSEHHIGLAERLDNMFFAISGLFIALFSGGLVYAYKQLRNDFNSYQENLKKELADKFELEKELIERTLDRTQVEENIKAHTRILIISKNGDNNQPLNTLKNRNGFSKVTVQEIEDDFSIVQDIEKYDLFILDNENGKNYHWKLSDEGVKNNLKDLLLKIKNKNKRFLYFGGHDPIADGGLMKDPVFKEGNYTGTCSLINNIASYIIEMYK